MSYTRKVTTVRTGCNGERIVTTTQQLSGGCVSNSSWFQQQIQQPFETMVNHCSNENPIESHSIESTSASSPSSSFEEAVLEEHNRLRARHSAAPLRFNSAMNQYAQEWANNLARRNTMQHRSNNKYGENLFASFGKADVTGEEAVRAWYNEIKDYRFGQSNPGNFSQVGHFTQLVWKGSRQLGVGKARNGNNIYVVCNYDPPGNYSGEYPANVTAS
ncbi:Golgi-associated plant pathogenesis-related protein 1-like [Malaya genurostris]|uniref:Golgi-associated plant pathogenesis-related protein 1-like n=1 Tax=Malaya genurostris TaxID=325434 RepID=UPI0026F3E3A8|nr:Golgi-associated plant pathogenesis-related protein 1-like [Malaya genurostris]